VNSNQITEGEFYAWHKYRQKGIFPLGAAKVRAGRIRKTKDYFDKNRRTEVEITVVEAGSSHMSRVEIGRTLFVPAREVIDFWDSYRDEESVIVAEREARQNAIKREARKKELRKQYVESKLREKGLPASATFDMYADTISMSLTDVLQWIGVSRGQLDEAVNNMLGSDNPDSTPGYATAPLNHGV
jgi:hypothetical protein